MTKIRLTKEFHFEMAHALWNYDGLCKNIHGHSYILFVTVIGEPISDKTNPKLGMVMDFGDLKAIVAEEIVDQLDHALVLSKDTPNIDQLNIPQMFDRFFVMDYQPTCENMIADFAERIKKRLPKGVELHSLKLHETATSFAEWYASDNQ
ncbi:6-pyruvoyl trahydropterin synthase family protein [Marinifilum caeruleilacunae]|jgi:6-pyruvoyltetrahydropterin/6-carboxytetrahydropterin synthase|uniref:6-carboxy-5,6,7,8-tetrahydropterin synthase n=1 Tax=Marinifilum caeruleilacunae TaxID=2499076 RepID=A0ABX1WUQ0_9BACT|nr:6-carboxytetrahydropterin synthase [Marinifilum caeruleilacunae]NOU59833.1 6-carboxytetrahydropterin synthase [Marinifilum caeruleilacunae]